MRKFLYRWFPQMKSLCNICFSTRIDTQRLTYSGEVCPSSPFVKYETLNFSICRDCGYSYCRENFRDSSLGSKGFPIQEKSLRIGDGLIPGREYFMTIGAIEALQKKEMPERKFKVLIYGSGKSRDHQLLRELDSVEECKITDLKNFQRSEYFIPMSTKEKFDIVIASEVVEHFMFPRKELLELTRYMNQKGLLILSTDIRHSVDLSKEIYPFLFGHTSFYSVESLVFLATINEIYIDFRIPRSKTFKSNTKRFIYMTKSSSVYSRLQSYFAYDKHPQCE